MKKHIPNTITCCNLISGCIAVVCALHGEAMSALLFIILGAVFDFFDGFAARLLHVSSPIGKELDSLADDVTFGVAPSAIIFQFLLVQSYPEWMRSVECCVPFVAFVMAAFSALRLAKFNLDERQSMDFIGLPTPANALFWGALIVGLQSLPESNYYVTAAVVAGIFVSSYLLVSESPMFALKFKTWGWKGNEIKFLFLLTCIPILIFMGITGFAAIIAWYVVLSVISHQLSQKE